MENKENFKKFSSLKFPSGNKMSEKFKEKLFKLIKKIKFRSINDQMCWRCSGR